MHREGITKKKKKKKIKKFGNATGIFIVPNWPNKFWFTVLQDLLLREAFIIPPNIDNLYLPNHPDLKHPFF